MIKALEERSPPVMLPPYKAITMAHFFSPSDLRVNVCDQNRVWFLTPSQVKSPVLIGGDNGPSSERNVITVSKRLKHKDHLSAIIFFHP